MSYAATSASALRDVEADRVRFDAQRGVAAGEGAAEGGHLQLADVGVSEQDLPVQVAGVDAIVVDHPDPGDAGRAQRQRRRAAQTAARR